MIIVLIIVCLIVLVLLIALFSRKVHHSEASIVINAPKQKVFDYLRLVKNQENYNKWAKAGEERNETHKGVDGMTGYIYAWSGNKKVGEGEKEITNIVEGETIEIEYRFVKPFKVTAHFVMTTEAVSENQTKVSWSNTSALFYPLNILVPMIEKSMARDMAESLHNLKNILEK